MNQPVIAAVIAAYKRDPELDRLLDSLEHSTIAPTLTVVVDNAGLDTTRQVVEKHAATHYHVSAANIGPGYAWKQGMQLARQHAPLHPTHFLVMDDDVVLENSTLEQLLSCADEAKAEMVAPLLSDHDSQLWGFPEPRDPQLQQLIRKVTTPLEALQQLGPKPHSFCWCTGACVLVSQRAVAAIGYHRTDFFMLGEDLEFSMRVANQFNAVFTCAATVPHLPPRADSPVVGGNAAGLRKFHCLLTNLGYLSFHCPHSFHMRRYLAGNYKRFFTTEGISVRTVTQAISCLWTGVVRGRPAGWQNRVPNELVTA